MSTEEPIPNGQADTLAEVRQRSTIEFPYQNLDSAVEVVKAVHAVGGQSCAFDALAAKLDMKQDTGGFRLRLSTAKVFGLLNYDRGTVTLSPIGIRMCDPDQESEARVDAFLAVPLYREIHERFKGTPLPPVGGLENAMVGIGVAPKQKEKARQVFQRSAKEAGFFKLSADRLVMPTKGKLELLATGPTGPKFFGGGPVEVIKKPATFGDADTLHPFIQGLLKTLPKSEGDVWPQEERKKWLQAAETIFNLIYKSE